MTLIEVIDRPNQHKATDSEDDDIPIAELVKLTSKGKATSTSARPSNYYQPQSPRPQTLMTPATDNHPQRSTKTDDQQADMTGKDTQKEATKTSKADADEIRK
ncbi:hypothetical protein FQA39_LY04891 [Lamprigera yunnana]|nr:hypothetical protein FQA39_LY04891 [Lamprigera yunnana]